LETQANTGAERGAMSELTLSYSLADQCFRRTKSLGILNLSVQLGQALAAAGGLRRLTVFSNQSLAQDPGLAGVEARLIDHAADSGLGRIHWDQWGCYAAARRAGNDWLFLPKGFASFVRRPPIRLAAYVHDVMHEFYARRFPSAIPPLERWYFCKSFAATLRDAEVIFTNTEFTRQEVLRVAGQLKIAPGKVEVAGIGFRDVPVVAPAQGKLNRIVVLASRLPHKRADLALDWMQRWVAASRFDGEVHVVGSLPEGVVLPSGSQWVQHHRPSDAEYHVLLSGARAVVYMSEYEGFGMPPVEATLAGACPVFSALPSTLEVMGSAGCRFSNASFDSFHAALDLALNTPAAAIGEWRQELLARHSWGAVVERVTRGLEHASTFVAPRRARRADDLSGAQKVIHIAGSKRWLARGVGWAAVGLRALRRRRVPAESARSVLIIEPFGLGDVILHEPMLRVLRGAGFDVTFCARSEWSPLFPDVPWIDSRIAWGQHLKARKYVFQSYWNAEFRQFCSELRRAARKGPLGIDTRGDIRNVVLLYAAGCRDVITLSSYLGSDLGIPPAAAQIVPFSPALRRWESNLRCLAPLGLATDGFNPPSFPHLVKPGLKRARVVGLLPVAPWPGKWWQPEKWQEVIVWLKTNGWEARGLCGPGQTSIARQQLASEVAVNEIRTVLEWADQLQELSALVTLDSGPMHLADALGIPVVALFGQGLLPFWAPSGPNSSVVTHQDEPGFQPRMPTEENTADGRRWMQRIQANEVIAALQPLLERSQSESAAATAGP
jgi:ADP-heptose:LPS heptosyltransferase/glycosyltransferase involved in cell wall biosynthesis